MIKKTSISISCVLFLYSFSAFATEPNQWYIDAKIGLSQPRKTTDDFSKGKLKNTALFDARLGYYFNDNFSSDISLMKSSKFDYNSTYKKKSRFTNNYYTYTNKSNVQFAAVAANVYAKTSDNEMITPYDNKMITAYIGVGIGITRNSLSNDMVTRTATSVYGVRTGSSKYNFMWQAMLGTKMKISNQFDITLEYKYMDLGKFKSATALTYYNVGKTGDETRYFQEPIDHSKLRSNSLLIGLRYNL